jgi:hypothetical protein
LTADDVSSRALRRAPPVELFASSPADPRARRPVDALRVAVYLASLLAAALLAEIDGHIDRGLYVAATSLPRFLRVLWLTGYWAALVWSLVLLGIIGFRRRLPLLFECIGSAGLALLLVVVTAGLVTVGDVTDVLARLVDSGGPSWCSSSPTSTSASPSTPHSSTASQRPR